MLALIAGTVSYLHVHLLVELHGQPGWTAPPPAPPLPLPSVRIATCLAERPEARSTNIGRRPPSSAGV
jgi:hypothetical protein